MMNNNQLSVSVIIPVYNGERYLHTAIDSVLTQTFPAVEIIVVDDGSTDGSSAVAGHFPPVARVVSQPNSGPAAARNRGVALAQGDLLAFLDADDWWHPTKLQRQVALLAEAPTLGYVLSHMHVVQEAGIVWPVALNQAHYQNEPPCFLPSALCVWRRIFDQIGPFDERYRYSDDADWFLRAKDAGLPMQVISAALVYKRIHAANLSHVPAMTRETLRAVHASIQRQRQALQKGENAQ